ncbi:phosphoribosylformylglycinamidine cyclo-ligase [Salsuginibacillus halophilus]|uniref:Phosphoribosylformylglycinamidine cyclo-ligase n=1 Tax=Salsuginibacillus halophilus TaxID=517424 RepID=A0A2P8HLI0_9BACI|nr:phosphoribosylformylglycinamidine cyclo-ligase [Salsuginibacillus halophilus]PSL47041.1 phosphoribosylformylglycinamidine cyclo-ligase [Salsuginibacillus halophilus]
MSDAYQAAGVDVASGYEAVRRMAAHVKRTERPEVLSGLGGFGGLFDISELPYDAPVLVSGTDGVGTKLKLAFQMDKHDTIGKDAVAMCVNDIAVQGAEPLFFLDYIACGELSPEKVSSIVHGIADGCVEAGCALVGGETAEMPGMYAPAEYDIAGFSVGAAEKHVVQTPPAAEQGDAVIGVASSGLHSNGFSLVRKCLLEEQGLKLDEVYAPLERPLGEELLEPTKIYAASLQRLRQAVDIRGMAHITGGGLYENVPRMLPEDVGASLDLARWEAPAVYQLLRETGGLTEQDMYHAFNMGIGAAVIVKEDDAAAAIQALTDAGETAAVIGTVTNEPGVRIQGVDHV